MTVQQPTRPTTQPPSGPAAPAQTPSSGAAAPLVPAPPRLRRRPVQIGLGVALVAFGALLAALVVVNLNTAAPVLALATDVPRGQPITQADLVVAQISPDPAISPVPAADVDTVVGQLATTDLSAGSLLVQGQTTGEQLPAAGQSIVVLALPNTRVPTTGLQVGDPVRVVESPPENAPAGEQVVEPVIQSAEIAAVRDVPEAELVVLDLILDEGASPTLAAAIATDRVSLVLDSVQP